MQLVRRVAVVPRECGPPGELKQHRMRDLAIDGAHHGLAGARHYRYEPTFLLRGLSDLHITFASPTD